MLCDNAFHGMWLAAMAGWRCCFVRLTQTLSPQACAPAAQIVDEVSGRVVQVQKTGFPDYVVWNPWVAKSQAMADFGDDEYKVGWGGGGGGGRLGPGLGLGLAACRSMAVCSGMEAASVVCAMH
jgi:hypothetical protein